MIGVVTSDKMAKTVVVQVTTRVQHERYQKYIERRAKYKAHDEKNEAKVGDTVEIVESRPLSHDKRWRVQRILQKAVTA